MREKGNKRRAHPGLRGQIFAVMAVFVAAVLVILWVFHLFLLTPMYVSIKERELRSTSVTVAEMVGVHNFQEMTDKLARKNDVCISVYEIVGRDAIIRANSHIHGSCIIHNVSSDSLLNRLYTGARKDTYYVERISENFFVSQQTPDVPESIISSRLTTTAGSSYLIVLNAEIEPVGNTTRTLAVQLGIITVILLINAAGFALQLSPGRVFSADSGRSESSCRELLRRRCDSSGVLPGPRGWLLSRLLQDAFPASNVELLHPGVQHLAVLR